MSIYIEEMPFCDYARERSLGRWIHKRTVGWSHRRRRSELVISVCTTHGRPGELSSTACDAPFVSVVPLITVYARAFWDRGTVGFHIGERHGTLATVR